MKSFIHIAGILVTLLIVLNKPSWSEKNNAALFIMKENNLHKYVVNKIYPIMDSVGNARNITVDFLWTEDWDKLTLDTLMNYDVVVFSDAGHRPPKDKRPILEQWHKTGKGFAAIHYAVKFEDNFEYFGEVLGNPGYNNHPEKQKAILHVENQDHPSTRHLPKVWDRDVKDEIYDFERSVRGIARILITADESSYEGGKMGDDHPVCWDREVDGNRIWCSTLGHTEEGWDDPDFINHMWGGVSWAAGWEETTNVKLTISRHESKTRIHHNLSDIWEYTKNNKTFTIKGARQ